MVPGKLIINGSLQFKYEPRELDDQGNITTPAFTTITERVVLEKASEYLFPPNLVSPEYSGNPGIIPPRSYVDLMDSLLDNKITDVSQRIDTLANATDVFEYRMLLDGESAECDGDLDRGYDMDIVTDQYPGYNPQDPSSYDPTEYQNGLYGLSVLPTQSNHQTQQIHFTMRVRSLIGRPLFRTIKLMVETRNKEM